MLRCVILPESLRCFYLDGGVLHPDLNNGYSLSHEDWPYRLYFIV